MPGPSWPEAPKAGWVVREGLCEAESLEEPERLDDDTGADEDSVGSLDATVGAVGVAVWVLAVDEAAAASVAGEIDGALAGSCLRRAIAWTLIWRVLASRWARARADLRRVISRSIAAVRASPWRIDRKSRLPISSATSAEGAADVCASATAAGCLPPVEEPSDLPIRDMARSKTTTPPATTMGTVLARWPAMGKRRRPAGRTRGLASEGGGPGSSVGGDGSACPGAPMTSCSAAEPSPQKSCAVGGQSSAEAAPSPLAVALGAPIGTSSSRGPSQSRGRRTTFVSL